MVVLNKIYTRTGDGGDTALGDMSRTPKHAARVEAYGTVDELNATVGLARLHADDQTDAALALIQNDLFDLGADLSRPNLAGDDDAGYPVLRMVAPQVDRLEAEIDATDALEDGDALAGEVGLAAHLAALETILYPESERLTANNRLAGLGTLEITPMEAPLTLFVWNRNRLMPARITQLQITEEAFDPALNPIRAKISLGLRVLSVTDLGFDHKGGSLYMIYQQQKERLAERHPGGDLGVLGIGEIP